MIQVGTISSGSIGPAHIEALRRLGGVNVVTLCDSSLVVVQERAGALHIPHAYGSIEALLAHPGLRVVHNCTPNHLHADINRQILRTGPHVSSRKPLCMTPDEAREPGTLVQQAGVVHGVSFVYRQLAMVQQTASMVRSGSAGRLFAVQGGYLQDWMLLGINYNWRVDATQGGDSRVVADIGPHWCDTVQFMTGERIVEVMADLAIVWPVCKASIVSSDTFGQQTADVQSEDKAVTAENRGPVLVRFDDGSKGCFSVSQVSAGRKNHLNFEINGSHCSLYQDQETPQQLWVGHYQQANQILTDDPGSINADVAANVHFPGGYIEGWPDVFRNMMRQFYQAVLVGRMPATAECRFAFFSDGTDAMYVIDAIIRGHQ